MNALGVLGQAALPTSWAEYWATSWVMWVCAFCVLAIYSYLFRDNAIYRAIVQVFIGINIGYGVIVLWREVLYPRWWLPMLDGFNALLFHQPGSPWGAMWAFVGLLGLLWYFQLSRKYLWLSRFVIGITVGIGAGLTFKSQFGQNIPQVVDSFKPLAPRAVAPQPRQKFTLPAATVPPAVVDPVAYFADDTKVSCVELLHGVTLWSTALTVKPVSALQVDGDDLVVPTQGAELRLDRRSGAPRGTLPDGASPLLGVFDAAGTKVVVHTRSVAGLETPFADSREITSACFMPKVLDAGGTERPLLFLVVGGEVRALEAPSGKPLWPQNVHHHAEVVADGGRTVFLVSDGLLEVVDANTGALLKRIQLSDRTGTPCIADMADPPQDHLMALVPVHESAIDATMIRSDLATARMAGEVVWSYDTGKAVIWASTLDGVVFVTGPDGGRAYEIPEVPKRLSWMDYANNWVFVIALLSVMTYFFFSFRQQTAKGLAGFSRVGRWTLMIGFGAIFGNTIMTRMSFLLDRLMFLIDDWLRPLLRFLTHLWS